MRAPGRDSCASVELYALVCFIFCVNIQKRCSEQLAGVHCQLAAHGTSLVRIVSGSSRCSWSRVLSVDELVMTRCMSAEETLEWKVEHRASRGILCRTG